MSWGAKYRMFYSGVESHKDLDVFFSEDNRLETISRLKDLSLMPHLHSLEFSSYLEQRKKLQKQVNQSLARLKLVWEFVQCKRGFARFSLKNISELNPVYF